MHEVIATTVRQCQRVILILSADEELSVAGNDDGELLRERSQLHYEQSISLYDALRLNDPKVILVEIGEQRLLTDEIMASKIRPELNNNSKLRNLKRNAVIM